MSAEVVPNTALALPAKKSKSRRFLRSLWAPMAVLLALAAGSVTGVIAAYEMNYSRTAGEVSALATYRPSVVTKVYADDGQTIIGEFALERRVPLKQDEIPQQVKNAILAIEDNRFYQHVGIDPIRIAGAGLRNLTEGTRQGGSTLTQQLAKNLFLTREQTLTRKFNEWLTAIQIERYYTKDQIMEMYVNNIFLGAGAYGIESGAEVYFGKQAKDLSLGEAALLAGIPRAPSEYSPTVNMQRATERRNLVLEQMAKNSYVTQAEADAASAQPIKLAESAYYPSMQQRSSPCDYPIEQIRQELEDRYTTRVAQGGLTVYSTINVEAQKKAMEVVQSRLRSYDRSRSQWRSDQYYVLAPGNPKGIVPLTEVDANAYKSPSVSELNAYKNPDWFGNTYAPDDYVMGLVMSIDNNNAALVRFGAYNALVTKADMGWGGRNPRDEFKPGYLGQFRVKEVDETAKVLKVELTQIPEVQAALVTINAKNGEIPVMAGGYNFQLGKFNNATQALRQTGSAFKPYIYTAAVEWGMTPDSIVSGAPIRKWGWSPQNYDGSHSHGNVPLKIALAKSYNVAAVHLMDMVGIQTSAQMVRRFGITNPMAPVLPSALGATEVPLIQMVSAYSAFPNKGLRMQPHLIRKVLDRDGNTLEEWQPTSYKVMNEYVAGTMVEMMQGVTRGGGTAANIGAAGHPLAGKTGTVNDHTDVWFVGYTPTYCTGVWMGHPARKESLGRGMTGGGGAGPFFNEFMNYFMKDKPRDSFFKTPKMPEDMKAIIEQRKREFAEAEALARGEAGGYRSGGYSRSSSSSDRVDESADTPSPELENIVLPPPEPRGGATGADTPPTTPVKPADRPTAAPPAAGAEPKPKPAGETPPTAPKPAAPKPAAAPPPVPGATRPRETDPKKPPEPKKQGKKGNDDP
jgi:penicillin-binding protein 1A